VRKEKLLQEPNNIVDLLNIFTGYNEHVCVQALYLSLTL